MRFNGDTANNYDWEELFASSVTPTTAQAGGANTVSAGRVAVNNNALGLPTQSTVRINGILGAQKKTYTHQALRVDSTTAILPSVGGGFWNSTAAITSISIVVLAGSFAAGTTIDAWAEF
jgi:hypothetical protein